MRKAARVPAIGLAVITAAGCVTQGRYDTVLEQLNTIRKDLNIAKAEELALTQEVKALESLKREARADVMVASAALQRAQEEAEAEGRTAGAQLVTLQRAVSQLNAQLLTLRDNLADAKGDTVALQEFVAAYRNKLRTELETGAPAQPPQVTPAPAPASPSLAASPQAGSTPDETSAQLPQPVRPPPAKQPPQKAQPAEPPDESLFSAIMEWIISLWRSIVSLWQWIFP